MSNLYQNFFREIENETVLFLDNNKVVTAKNLQDKILAIHKIILTYSDAKTFAICTNNRFLFTAALFAVIYAEKVPIVLGHSKAKLLNEQKALFDIVLTDHMIEIESHSINIDKIVPEDISATDYTLFDKNISDQMVVLMTSGSSSEPKKIVKSIQDLAVESEVLIDQWQHLLKNTRVISTVSHLHQYGITFNILLPLMMKSPIEIQQLFYQEELAKLSEAEQYVLITSPAFLKRLDKNLQNNLNFKLIFSAGGQLGDQAAEDCQHVFNRWPIEIYGSSESGVIAFNQHGIAKQDGFQPFPQVLVQQFEDDTIKISSPLCENSAELRLNDRIELMSNGNFRILGRTDKIVKIEEKRVSLTEIEVRIKGIIDVEHVYAFVLPNKHRDVIGCVIVSQRQSNERELISRLTKELKLLIEPIAVPKRWRFVTEVPMNAQGKISLLELRELFDD